MEYLQSSLARMGRKLLLLDNSRKEEYDFAWKYLSGCSSILDVGCGVGLFMEYAPERITGIDINPNNVGFCRSKGLNAFTGDALKLDFPDNSFDGVLSAHVMHIFNAREALTYVMEMCRVCKPGGKIAISIKHDSKYFWKDPENSRPYPPSVFYGISSDQPSADKPRSNPMWEDLPSFEPIAIDYRRPPFFYFMMYGTRNRMRISALLNMLQVKFFIRKYWTFDAYTIVLENRKELNPIHRLS